MLATRPHIWRGFCRHVWIGHDMHQHDLPSQCQYYRMVFCSGVAGTSRLRVCHHPHVECQAECAKNKRQTVAFLPCVLIRMLWIMRYPVSIPHLLEYCVTSASKFVANQTYLSLVWQILLLASHPLHYDHRVPAFCPVRCGNDCFRLCPDARRQTSQVP